MTDTKVFTIGRRISAPPSDTHASENGTPSHHIQKRFSWFRPLFTNPWTTWKDPSPVSLAKALWQMLSRSDIRLDGTLINNLSPQSSDYATAFPLSPVDWQRFTSPIKRSEIRCVWIGHASCLVRMADVTFLTDPVFSQRCSPVQFYGPHRVVPPAFYIDDPSFAHLDFVVISHNHYDHLDYHSVMQLSKKFGPNLKWYVPLGLKIWFTRCGISNVYEMDWWQTTPFENVCITFLPAQHWSNRTGVLDVRRTLWGGWLVRSANPDLKVWFAGDSGYCPVFKEIGERCGPMDLSLIPIGSYEPRFLMRPQHVNADEAVEIHKDVQSRHSMGIHCCTFCLSFEPMDLPPRRCQEIMKRNGLDENAFLTVRHGEMIQIVRQRHISLPKVLPMD